MSISHISCTNCLHQKIQRLWLCLHSVCVSSKRPSSLNIPRLLQMRVQPFEHGRKRKRVDRDAKTTDTVCLHLPDNHKPIVCVLLLCVVGWMLTSLCPTRVHSWIEQRRHHSTSFYFRASPNTCPRQTGPVPLYSRYLECLSSNSR